MDKRLRHYTHTDTLYIEIFFKKKNPSNYCHTEITTTPFWYPDWKLHTYIAEDCYNALFSNCFFLLFVYQAHDSLSLQVYIFSWQFTSSHNLLNQYS